MSVAADGVFVQPSKNAARAAVLLNNVMQRLLAHNVRNRCADRLQRVVHRLRGYVRGRERCVRPQAITKTALLCVFASVCWLAKTAGCIKSTMESSRASPDPFERVYGQA